MLITEYQYLHEIVFKLRYAISVLDPIPMQPCYCDGTLGSRFGVPNVGIPLVPYIDTESIWWGTFLTIRFGTV